MSSSDGVIKGLFLVYGILSGCKKIPKVLLFRKRVGVDFSDFLEDNV